MGIEIKDLNRLNTMKHFLSLFEVLEENDSTEFIMQSLDGNPHFDTASIKFLSGYTPPQSIVDLHRRVKQNEGTAELFITILDKINKIADDCGICIVSGEIEQHQAGFIQASEITITLVGFKANIKK